MHRFLTLSQLVLLALLASGCSSSVHGIKMRVQSPRIDEAFRKLALAVRADDYEIERTDPTGFALETKWRDLKEKEKSEADHDRAGDQAQSKVSIVLSPRGLLYDLFLTPTLRYAVTDSSHQVFPVPNHPLMQKWRRIVNAVLEEESKEE